MSDKTLESFEALSTILEASGVRFKVETTRMYDPSSQTQKTLLKTVHIELPEGGKHNRGGHTIEITPRDFHIVKCGYVSDEDLFIDDAKRQALSEIKALVD